ncbi:MAG: bifunctional acetate--CoA ligase family protein/GNAT family N-acetyltransferase [Acidobacteria bacterium]|nr:bifunctional acetate--CoA ligase family protein/GNAT family N-acetyltransferase [Acidobacteriota bacterium]MBI3282049.1 bifunctional acetate--CoA ligase family protein/GNAT family N-acetyltransferase [Acidobacteriota bacterium]
MSMLASPNLDVLTLPKASPLDRFFAPRSIAVVGATPHQGKVGHTVLSNLIAGGRHERVYPINPNRDTILGLKTYRTIREVPGHVDLAVVVTPATTVPRLVEECAVAGVKAVLVISAGFREIGPEGAALEQQMLRTARAAGIRIIGPNCLGVMNPHTGLNATFAAGNPEKGTVAFLSQSGAMCTAVLDWSRAEHVGFSAFVSIGSMLDVGWGDLIHYFGEDPHTRSIVIYMESVGDPRSFISAAREIALQKPIIVIKAGRTEAAARATVSHTGSLAGSDAVLDAAFHRCGVLRVNHIADVFYMAEVLGKQPRPSGPRLSILTNAGGPGVLATDALILNGGELAELPPETVKELDSFLPPHWSRHNPIDILGDADPERYARAIEVASRNPGTDGLLVVLTPQAMTDPTRTAECVARYARLGKPILASWMGGAGVAEGVDILNRAGIPTFPYPDTAARAFEYMWQYSSNIQSLYETPSLLPESSEEEVGRAEAGRMIESARQAGRTLLTEAESKRLLQFYGIPVAATRVAASPDEACSAADATGYPVVVKLHSESLTHKTDVGGVRLNVCDSTAVRKAFEEIRTSVSERAGSGHFEGVTVQPMLKGDYELILGSSIDPQFGPILLFGAGGQLVEVFKDRSIGLPPLNTTLARRMMERTRIYKALLGVRGRKPVNLAALEGMLVRFSRLVVEHPAIREIDINPLLASAAGIVALDARVVLGGKTEEPPRPAIRPYPHQYAASWTLTDGRNVSIRPIRPEDEPLIAAFHQTLSDTTVYRRYFSGLSLSARTAHERLTRVCFIDYDREMALVAEGRDPHSGDRQILGVARFIKDPINRHAEFALVVSDQVQRRGLGTELLKRLLQVARGERVGRLMGWILPENTEMQQLCEKLGFFVRYDADENMALAIMDL